MIHQPCNPLVVKSSEEKDCEFQGRAYERLQSLPKATRESHCIDVWYNPSWLDAQPTKGSPAAPTHTCLPVVGWHNPSDGKLRKGSYAAPTYTRLARYNPSDAKLRKGSYPVPTHTHLAINHWYNPSDAKLRKGSYAAPTDTCLGELCHHNHKITHDNTLLHNDESTAFVALLRTCAKNKDLHMGFKLHEDILKRKLLHQCTDALITMYARCGAFDHAEELLDLHKSKSVFPWTALIAGYGWHGRGQDALNCFERMQAKGIHPDAVTFACILKVCVSLKAYDKGELYHGQLARQGLLRDNLLLGNILVNMYAKCGALAKARCVLEELPSRDVVSWNALITGYAQQGQGEQALNCFKLMQREGISPNAVTFTCILKACGSIKAVDKGEQIHDEIARRGLLQNDIVLGNALVDMYVKCGALEKARRVLGELPSRNVVSWSALIAGYAQQGQGEQALHCLKEMQCDGFSPDAVTFACILNACATIGDVDKGEQIHDEIVREGLLDNDIVLGNALVDMYAKCGDLAKAYRVLEELPSRDVFPWNSLIAGHAQQGQCEQAMQCLDRMQQEGVSPNASTFTCVLKACGSAGAVDMGKQIHDEIAKQGLLRNNVILGNALVDMYAKCGAVEKAQRVLEELPVRNIVAWSALIAGYAQLGRGEEAMKCFEWMQSEGLSPDEVTFATILKACASVGAVDKGQQIHDQIAMQGLLRKSVVLGNALVDMYAKCSFLAKAQLVLDELPSRNVVSWNALIAGYVQHGHGEQALSSFKRMRCEGISPNAVTFSCVLNACSHLGLVEDGHLHFVSMSTKYGVKPELEHYTCMIGMFGRTGHLGKAVQVIQEMPSSDYSGVWSTLLGACQKWGDVSVGRWAFERAIQVDKSDVSAYVLMANIYAVAGMKEDAESIEAMQMEINA